MNITIQMINVIFQYIGNFPDLIENPSEIIDQLGIQNYNNARLHVYLAIYIYQNNDIENFTNLTIQEKEEIINASGIIPLPYSNNFISLKHGYIDNNFFNVDATIIFRNNNRNFLFQNNDYKIYKMENNEWKYYANFYQNELQYNMIYKLIENTSNKIAYVIFIDISYTPGSIKIENFVRDKVNYSLELLRNMLGSHGVNKLGMSFTFMHNHEDDIIALPVMINTVQGFLLSNNNINNVIMIDFGNSFNNYYRTNYQFILN